MPNPKPKLTEYAEHPDDLKSPRTRLISVIPLLCISALILIISLLVYSFHEKAVQIEPHWTATTSSLYVDFIYERGRVPVSSGLGPVRYARYVAREDKSVIREFYEGEDLYPVLVLPGMEAKPIMWPLSDAEFSELRTLLDTERAMFVPVGKNGQGSTASEYAYRLLIALDGHAHAFRCPLSHDPEKANEHCLAVGKRLLDFFDTTPRVPPATRRHLYDKRTGEFFYLDTLLPPQNWLGDPLLPSRPQ